MALSIFTGIVLIPERSEATPGLWNTIFSTISANLDTLNSDKSVLASSIGTTTSSVGFSSNTLRPETSGLTIAVTAAPGGASIVLLSPNIESLAFADRFAGSTLTARVQNAINTFTYGGLVVIPSYDSATRIDALVPSITTPVAILDLRYDGSSFQPANFLLTDGTAAALNSNGPRLFAANRTVTAPPATGWQTGHFTSIFTGTATNSATNPVVTLVSECFLGRYTQTSGVVECAEYTFGFPSVGSSVVSVLAARLFNATYNLGVSGSAGTIGTITAFYAQSFNTVASGLTITNAYGIYAQDPAGSGLANVLNAWAAWIDGRTVVNADGSAISMPGLRVRGNSTSRTSDVLQVTDSGNADAIRFSVSSKGTTFIERLAVNVGGQPNFVYLNGDVVVNADAVPVGTVGLTLRGNLASRTTDLLQITDSQNNVPTFSFGTRGQSRFTSGTTSSPALQFLSETSLGWFRSAASTMALSYGTLTVPSNVSAAAFYSSSAAIWLGNVASQLRLQGSGNVVQFLTAINAFAPISVGSVNVQDGGVANPAYAFTSDGSLGWYRSVASTIAQSMGTLDLTAAVTSMGSIRIKSGANNSCGTAALGSNGSVNVANTYVAAGDLIFLTDQTAGGTLGDIELGGIRAGSGFTIQSTSITDTSTVAWLIIRPT